MCVQEYMLVLCQFFKWAYFQFNHFYTAPKFDTAFVPTAKIFEKRPMVVLGPRLMPTKKVDKKGGYDGKISWLKEPHNYS